MSKSSRRNFIKSTVIQSGAICALTAGQKSRKPPRIPLVAFRAGIALWQSDEPFHALLDFFARQPGAVDELAFFTSATHPPAKLSDLEPRAERLAKIFPLVRQRGIGAGINVLATIGHIEENLPNSLQSPWQRMRDPWGRECLGAFCPAQPEFLEYIRRVYAMMAQTGPDFIWIDDDVRLQGHKPVGFGCFCATCVRQFSEQAGMSFTSETLIGAFDSGALEERLRWRRLWLEHNRKLIDSLLRTIESAVHQVKPDLSLGLMTGDRFYEGYDFERWATTLAGPANVPVRWRPGGGFYSDETPLGLLDKANEIGRQVAALPKGVEVIESEVENFPYQRLRKSERTTVVEAAAHIATGSTGTAFNVLTMFKDPLDEYAPLFTRIAESRQFYAQLRNTLGRSTARGIWPVWNRDLFATVNLDGEWLSRGRVSLSEPYVLGEIGIPLCYDPAGATAAALCGTSIFAFSKQKLQHLFAAGVLMDVDGWHAMKRLGLEAWTGISAVDAVDRDAVEVFAAHPLNGRFGGWSRDCRQSFWWERAYVLRSQAKTAESLAHVVDYGHRDLGPCMTACTNELGGRVVVMGYYPWSQIHSLAKSTQMKAVCDWLSMDRLPVLVESFAKTAVWYRGGGDQPPAIVVLNASLDPLETLILTLRQSSVETRFTHVSDDGRRASISSQPLTSSAGDVRITINRLPAWSIHLILSGEGNR